MLRSRHAAWPQPQAVRRAIASVKSRLYDPSPARTGSQAGFYSYNPISNRILVNSGLGPSPCTLETGLRSPLLCWRQGLCPLTKDARQTRAALGTENALRMKKLASRAGGSPTSGPPDAVLADKCSLVGYHLQLAQDTPRRHPDDKRASRRGAAYCRALLELQPTKSAKMVPFSTGADKEVQEVLWPLRIPALCRGDPSGRRLS
jgi:hypothetical protein